MSAETITHENLTTTIRDAATRATVAVGLLGVGLIHLIDSIDKYSETRYQFWMFIGLILGSVSVAGALLFTRHRLAMPAAIALTTSALIGFILSRTTGLPNATGDVGNWTEPIGLANLFVEGAILAVAIPAQLMTGRVVAKVAHARGTRAATVAPAH